MDPEIMDQVFTEVAQKSRPNPKGIAPLAHTKIQPERFKAPNMT